MGFARPSEQVAILKDSDVTRDSLLKACVGKTAADLRHVTTTEPLEIPIDLSAVDSVMNSLTLCNYDFEQAELHPNYARFEHTDITDLIVGSYVVCDIIDSSSVQRLKVFGETFIKFDAYIHSLDVTPVGRVTILGCDVDCLDVTGTVILSHCNVNTMNLRAGGRVYLYDTKIKCPAYCDRPAITGKLKLNDPFVMNLLAMSEFEYSYG